MTVSTHREPFIDLVEFSVAALGNGTKLHIAGLGDYFKVMSVIVLRGRGLMRGRGL